MKKINIIGNASPEIATVQEYSLFKAFEISEIQSPAFQVHQETAQWEIYVLERSVWRKTDRNSKTGDIVTYTFNQKSLTRQGVKLIVTKGREKAELTIKPKPAGKPKINKIELLDVHEQKVDKVLNYMDTLIAKAHCTDMENQVLYFTLWEDDAKGSGHNAINQPNKINLVPQKATVKNGIAKVRFNMAQYFFASKIANMHVAKGDKNEGKTHEYYVTAEYYGKLEASNNVNVKNPAYNPQQPKTSGNKPTSAPKQPNKKPVPPKPAPKKETYKTPVTHGAKTKAPDPQGKIISAEFVDFAGRPYKEMKFGTNVKARIATQNMKGKIIILRIWEDDIYDQQVFEKNYVVVADLSEVTINLSRDMRTKGDDWKEGREQEYFLEIEYAGQSIDSEVINVNDSAPRLKVETGRSMQSVGKDDKQEENKDDKCPNCEKDITADDLKTIFPDADAAKRKTVADTYNKYMKDLNMNTCWNKAHFFAQARVEGGLALNMKNGENFNYYYVGLSIFGAFQTKEGKEKAKLWGRPTKLPKLPGVNDVDQIKIANYAYSPPAKKAKELENTEPNDGWNYRGRGLIQVTGKGFYKYCNTYSKMGGYDIVSNPNLLGEKIELAVLASMVFFKWKGINKIANGTKNVKGKICPEVGADVKVSGKSNYDEKQKAFNDITSKIYKVDKCIWGKVVDESVKSSDDSVLEEMKKLVDKHIPYSQSGTRNDLTEEGLENLDCSETVGIYLYKLGVMPNYKAIDTSTMTTEDNLRKTIGTNNIDLISGSDEKDFKPQRGDIFVWRKGAAGPGHTGIVYKYDEANDVVTILESIGSVGAVSESDQVKNGGYSKAGCSRTAKYSRLKGALYGHKGWAGYFRPKNYTKKL